MSCSVDNTPSGGGASSVRRAIRPGVGRDPFDVVRDERRCQHQPKVARDRRLQGHRALDGRLDVLLRRLRPDRAGDDLVRRLLVGIAEQLDRPLQQGYGLLAGYCDRRVEPVELPPQRLAHLSPSGR